MSDNDWVSELEEHTARLKAQTDDVYAKADHANALRMRDAIARWVNDGPPIPRFQIHHKIEGVKTLPASELPGEWMKFAADMTRAIRAKPVPSDEVAPAPPEMVRGIAAMFVMDVPLYERPGFFGTKWVPYPELSSGKQSRWLAALGVAWMIGMDEWERGLAERRAAPDALPPHLRARVDGMRQAAMASWREELGKS